MITKGIIEKINDEITLINYINIEKFSRLEKILKYLSYLNFFSIYILIGMIYLFIIRFKDKEEINNTKIFNNFNFLALFLLIIISVNGFYIYDIKLNILNYATEFSDNHIEILNILFLIPSVKTLN